MIKMITPWHVKKSRERTGKEFKEIHEWLDNCRCNPFEDYDNYPMQHRIERHNIIGLLEIKKMFGEEAYKEAKLHLVEDGVRI